MRKLPNDERRLGLPISLLDPILTGEVIIVVISAIPAILAILANLSIYYYYTYLTYLTYLPVPKYST